MQRRYSAANEDLLAEAETQALMRDRALNVQDEEEQNDSSAQADESGVQRMEDRSGIEDDD